MSALEDASRHVDNPYPTAIRGPPRAGTWCTSTAPAERSRTLRRGVGVPPPGSSSTRPCPRPPCPLPAARPARRRRPQPELPTSTSRGQGRRRPGTRPPPAWPDGAGRLCRVWLRRAGSWSGSLAAAAPAARHSRTSPRHSPGRVGIGLIKWGMCIRGLNMFR